MQCQVLFSEQNKKYISICFAENSTKTCINYLQKQPTIFLINYISILHYIYVQYTSLQFMGVNFFFIIRSFKVTCLVLHR